jgi:hypothetical protein
VALLAGWSGSLVFAASSAPVRACAGSIAVLPSTRLHPWPVPAPTAGPRRPAGYCGRPVGPGHERGRRRCQVSEHRAGHPDCSDAGQARRAGRRGGPTRWRGVTGCRGSVPDAIEDGQGAAVFVRGGEPSAAQCGPVGPDEAAPDAVLADGSVPQRQLQARAAHGTGRADGDGPGRLAAGCVRFVLTGNHSSGSSVPSAHRAFLVTSAAGARSVSCADGDPAAHPCPAGCGTGRPRAARSMPARRRSHQSQHVPAAGPPHRKSRPHPPRSAAPGCLTAGITRRPSEPHIFTIRISR